MRLEFGCHRTLDFREDAGNNDVLHPALMCIFQRTLNLNSAMLRILLLVHPLFLSAIPSVAQPAPPRIDAYTARVLSAFEVPGIALAIVKDGHVVLAKGYGVREMGNPARVGEDAGRLAGDGLQF